MVSASLQIKSSQIKRQITGELEQLVPELLRHHVLLCRQLGLVAD